MDSASGASVAAQRSRSARRALASLVLPRVVGGQVEFAGAARDADAAADAHEPVVFGERLAGLAGQVVDGAKSSASSCATTWSSTDSAIAGLPR